MNLNKLTIPTRLYLLTAVFGLAFLSYGLWSRTTLNLAKVHGPYYTQIVQGKDLIADILPPPNYIIESYLMVLHMANEVDEGADQQTIQGYADRCKQLRDEFDDRHAHWVADLPDDEMKRIKTVDCYDPAIRFYDILSSEFVPACLLGDAAAAKKLSRGSLREHYETHRTAIDKVVQMATERCAAVEAETTDVVSTRTAWSTALGLILIVGCGGAGWWTAQHIIGSLKTTANALTTVACEDLKNSSNQMRSNAASTSDQASQASDAAQMVSANVQSLATAVDEFDSSIKEISGNTTNAVSVARTAVDAVGQTTDTVTKLGASSSEIGNVIKAINSIAEQTNLLALNATIEAARAGEAGKGFAVVANEVKELAKQTSTATEDIIGHIGTIQEDTEQAVSAITRVSEIINEISESQNAIASAVEEQSAMTSEISRSITEVSAGSDTISQNINCVAQAAESTSARSDEALKTSEGIEDLASELMELIGEVQAANQSGAESRGKYQLETADPRSLTDQK